MLESLRNSVNGVTAKILIALLVLSFAAWGIADVFTGRTQTVAASVGEAEVESRDYARALSDQLTSLRQRTGGNVSLEDARRLGVDRTVLAQLTTSAALDEEAREFGLSASDVAVAEAIREAPAFANAFGEFDADLYKQRIGYQGLSTKEFEESVRKDLARDALLQAIGGGTTAPRALVEALHQYRNERRDFTYVTLTRDDAPDPGEPDEATLKTFHEENAARFTAPEYRKLEFVALTPLTLAESIDISDAALRDAYEDRLEDYTTPERRVLDQIPFDDEDDARAAKERIEGGESFAKVAESRGLSSRDATLGRVTTDELPDALAGPAFDAKETGLIGPVRTSFGWTLMNLRAIEEGGQKPFEDVKDALRRELAEIEAENVIHERAVDLDDQIAGGAPLTTAAERSGAIHGEIVAVDASGRNEDGAAIEGLPQIAEFLPRVFEAETGADPIMIESAAGEYFALKVEEVTPAALRPLEDIRDEVAEAWAQERRDEALEVRAGEITGRLNEGGTLAAVAEELDREAQPAASLSRTASTPGIGAELLGEIFKADESGALSGPGMLSGQRLVGVVSNIRIPEDAQAGTGLDTAIERHAAAVANDMIQRFSQTALDQREVLINTQVVDRTLGELGQRF